MRNQSVTHSTRDRSADASRSLVFQALADPTRRALLDQLRGGSRPAGHMALSFAVSRPAISKHLRLLHRAKLVVDRRHGRHRYYELNPQPLEAVDRWLSHYRAFWQMKLADLKSFVESGASHDARHEHRRPGLRRRRNRH
jgi:DNA-binding transcriptional ArsR family regulator